MFGQFAGAIGKEISQAVRDISGIDGPEVYARTQMMDMQSIRPGPVAPSTEMRDLRQTTRMMDNVMNPPPPRPAFNSEIAYRQDYSFKRGGMS